MFTVIAALFTLCFSAITNYYNMQTKQPDFLSNSFVTVHIQQYLPDTEIPVTVKDLIDYSNTKEFDLIIYRNYPISHGKAVFIKGETSFNPNIIEGRNFCANDFKVQAPTAIIADYLIDECKIENNKIYFIHDNNEYEVIGKFKRDIYYVDNKYSANYFTNMSAYLDMDLNSSLSGWHTFDAKEKSKEFLEGFISFAMEINPNIQISITYEVVPSKTQRILQSIDSSLSFIIVLGLAILLILLNISNVTNYWLGGRKKEIAVRMLSGGKPSNIKWMLLRDYLFITLIGYIIGLIIGVSALYLEIFSFIGKTIYPIALISVCGMCLIVGLISGFIILNNGLRKNIILQLKG